MPKPLQYDLQELCDLLIEVGFTDLPLKTIGAAYGIKRSYLSKLCKRLHVHRKPPTRKITPLACRNIHQPSFNP